METWVENFFYSEPPQLGNAPDTRHSSGRSRIVDIYQICNPPAPARLSYNEAGKVTAPAQLIAAVDNGLIETTPNTPQIRAVDRVYYENNWRFARSFLCRQYVKDIGRSASGVSYEDPSVTKFERFLNAAARRHDLSFISRGLSTCDGKLLASKDRLLFTFGFDWLGGVQPKSPSTSSLMDLRYNTGGSHIVRRTTAIALIIKVANTDSIAAHCHGSWTSNNHLRHRRTAVLFNELHASDDGLPFTRWISPDAPGRDLWEVPRDPQTLVDDERAAIAFINRFVARIWQGVVSDLEKVIDECSKHIIFAEQQAFHQLNVEKLESVAHETWRDMMTWHVLAKLIAAQRKSVSETRTYVRGLLKRLEPKSVSQEDSLLQHMDALTALEKTVSEDFRSRGQSITDLVYNLINVRNAQAAQRSADAAQQESRDLGRITWITFIFLPLIAVSGMFGMNVDVLVNKPPSIRWYFAAVVPFSVLILAAAFLTTKLPKRMRMRLLPKRLPNDKTE